ncbi:MAG: hypothetical protein ACI4XS_14015 [Bacillus sp. (in: firmicutes)]
METIFAYFVVYSFLGWVCECVYCAVLDRHFVNRGFLNGPFCPIYGCGALAVLILFAPFSNHLAFIFLSGAIAASIIEYITSYLLEKLLNLKLWDYSHNKLNINGRVCLRNSTLFGILSVLLVAFIHPRISHLLAEIPVKWLHNLAIGFFIYFIIDTLASVHVFIKLKTKFEQVYALLEEKRALLESYKENLQLEWDQKRAERSEELNARIDQIKAELSKLHHYKFPYNRILKAYPRIQSVKNQLRLHTLIERIKESIKN